jgi:predicted kinase
VTTGVLVLSGPPCSGKSSVGRLLAAGAAGRQRVAVEVDLLFDLLLPCSDRNRDDRMLAYDAAHAVAGACLDRGRMPVLECTYSRRAQRAGLVEALAAHPSAPLWVVELTVTADDAVARWRGRSQETDLTEHLVRSRAETFPACDHALRLDSAAATPSDLARQIETWLEHEPHPVEPRAWAEAGLPWD